MESYFPNHFARIILLALTTEKICHRQVEHIHLTMIAFSGGYLV